TPPVSPLRSLQRREPVFRLNAGQPLEIVPKLRFLGGELRMRCEMLQRASAAHAKVRASGLHAFRRRLEHLHQPTFVVLTTAFESVEADPLAGQRTCDKDGLARAHDALALV